MNTIDERKTFIQKGVQKLAEKWLPGEPEVAKQLWQSGISGHLSGQARKNVKHVRLITDRFPQHPIPFVCEESGISAEKIPINAEVVFSFTDEKVLIKYLGKPEHQWEVLYEKK